MLQKPERAGNRLLDSLAGQFAAATNPNLGMPELAPGEDERRRLLVAGFLTGRGFSGELACLNDIQLHQLHEQVFGPDPNPPTNEALLAMILDTVQQDATRERDIIS